MRLWDLSANGFGNEYYAAGVRSMLQGFGLFFYNAFDPAGLVSLDKPPLAFWIQAVFAAVLGYSGWAIHLPQALAGTASVALLYFLLRKPFGRTAALLAAFLLALSPIAVAADRSNNTDSWLVLFLLVAARNPGVLKGSTSRPGRQPGSISSSQHRAPAAREGGLPSSSGRARRHRQGDALPGSPQIKALPRRRRRR